jgi:predicted transcriptional regulator
VKSKLTEAEWQIMNTLWDHYPATARDVLERLPNEVDWAYTTLKTLLSRMVSKGLVSERKRGNTSIYEPDISRTKARWQAVSSVMDQAFEGAVEPMLHFLLAENKLSQKERRELARMLDSDTEGTKEPK